MKRFLVIGRTGVGKSSFVNATFGNPLSPTSPYEACTKVVERFAHGTPFGDVCLIDTPGLAEADHALDEEYLQLIRRQVDVSQCDAVLYLSRLDETRLRADEMRSLSMITHHLGVALWGRAWLVLTFAASVPADRRAAATESRINQIEGHLRAICAEHWAPTLFKFTPPFHAFQVKILVDNVVDNWASNCRPIAAFL